MNIYLFLKDKISLFSLPKEVSGSFRFDEDVLEEEKLINIEARNGKWVLYATGDVTVLYQNTVIKENILEPNTFYILRRNEQNYLIYVSEVLENNFTAYTYDSSIHLQIGKGQDATVFYNCPYLSEKNIQITCLKNQVVLEKQDGIVYVNHQAISNSSYIIQAGDQVQIYGLKLLFLPGILLVNHPGNTVKINDTAAHIKRYTLPLGQPPQNRELKDLELYSKDDYFSKSPRIRRMIETKVIKLSPPPRKEGSQELPLILTIGPMLTMGVMSGVMMVNTINRIQNGETTLAQSWPSLATSGAMLVSILLWPLLTKVYNNHMKKKRREDVIKKYGAYLKEKKKELDEEARLQRDILQENLIPVEECLGIIQNKTINFWDKRLDQSDFLVTRIGRGNLPLDVSVEYPEEGFTVDEDDLRKQADAMVEEFKYITNVPIGYSFYENKITAVMGSREKRFSFMDNILLQLLTFYSYEDLKIVVFTNESQKKHWEYIKYLPHNFTNERSFRFFSANSETAKSVAEFLSQEVSFRIDNLQEEKSVLFKPHYLILIDDYERVKRFDFIKTLTEIDANLGFSIVILEERLSHLPSKCNNFISLGSNKSGVLKNSYEKQEQIVFYDEINTHVNMMQVAKILSNIPIEFENGIQSLPDAITFLEMEKVGKVEQLNILNRWNTNDATTSLKAEVGVDDAGELMYLDLHEKFHGPHGLIAGMTGSGKSEFIITYILSMAINYSPDDVSFILIDYKGGGLAYAFENKATGMILPHLAGTITNLDKSELDRTLVSIDSEIKRRQQVFNEARDTLGESTIDIYKYQRYFKEGKLKEAVPHLFIICDEFAELKSQQPDFMDNLISVARIGRSLGVHLILATQKPSGVVNDQIWSNSKFRVCLKVQDASDSKEMLKRPDAASLKQTGRFYLQVGYDEYFALGQSGWCGAKYYPSDKLVKQVDRSVNFLNDCGIFMKSIQADNTIKVEAQGEQLPAILSNIIAVSKSVSKQANRLWLENISPIILVDDLIKKYQVVGKPYQVEAILGEYDAPEKQEQGLLKLAFLSSSNTLIYGNDSAERELLMGSILYSTMLLHKVEEVNFYMFDYGSESFRMFSRFPHIGGMVFTGEDEKYRNLLKLLERELNARKRKFVNYGGEYQNYNASNDEKLPLIVVMINSYDTLLELQPNVPEHLASFTRDCERYGIIFIVSCNGMSSIGRRIAQNFDTVYTLHLTDPTDYYSILNTRNRLTPRNIFGRGLVKQENVHEFQTASLVPEGANQNAFLKARAEQVREVNQKQAKGIPTLPEVISLDLVAPYIKTLSDVPVGMSKEELYIVKYDFLAYPATIITSSKLVHINSFIKALVEVFRRIPDTTTVFIDTLKLLPEMKEKVNTYCDTDLDTVLSKLTDFVKNKNEKEETTAKTIFIFYGLEKLKTVLDNITVVDNLFKEIKKSENMKLLFCESNNQLKSLDFDNWYTQLRNSSDGIYIGKGFANQTTLRVGKITKEMNQDISLDYGYCVKDSSGELVKLISLENAKDGEETL